MKPIIKRFMAPTPKFFEKIRNISLLLTGISTALLTAPVVLPAVAVTVAGYLAVAGGIASAISQASIKNEAE